jgi:hypothetical protein
MARQFGAVLQRSLRTAEGKADSKSKMMIAVRAACRRHGLDEDERKAMQFAITGIQSMSDMSLAQLGQVLDHLNKGWSGPQGKRATTPKIRALWWTLYWLGVVDDPKDAAIDTFVRRQSGIAALRFVDHKAAQPIIEALKSWAAREGVKWPTDAELAEMKSGNPGLTMAQYERHAVLTAVGRKLYARRELTFFGAIPYVEKALGLGGNHFAWTAHELDAAIKLLGKKLRRAMNPRGGEE